MYFIETGATTSEPDCAMSHSVIESDSLISDSITEILEATTQPTTSELSEPSQEICELPPPPKPPAAKKRKVSTQDIQQMQLEVLTIEKKKIEMEVENMQLMNQKLRLEIQELLARSQPVITIVEDNN